MAPVFYLILHVLLQRFRTVSMADLKITLTAPINPVEAGNMLSIHCQVVGLSFTRHTLELARNVTGVDDRISFDNTMMEETDERFFLASRRLQNQVYFLSIIDITREDEGVYHCVVREKSSLRELQRKSVTVLFKYFPADIYPKCSPESEMSGGLTVYAGRSIQLNCTSELANPHVTIEWTRADQVINDNIERHEENGNVVLTLTLRPTMDEDNAIYVCQITSNAFPETSSTCHVGPLKVIRDPSAPVTRPPPKDNTVPLNRVIPHPGTTASPNDVKHGGGPTYITTECSEVCDENILYWIIATIIAGTLAVVFCIIGIVIFVRYRRRRKEETKKKESSRNSHYQNREAIYAEVDLRPSTSSSDPPLSPTTTTTTTATASTTPADENKLYMAVDKSSYISTIDTSRVATVPEAEPLYSQNTQFEDPYSTRNVTHTTFGL